MLSELFIVLWSIVVINCKRYESNHSYVLSAVPLFVNETNDIHELSQDKQVPAQEYDQDLSGHA